MLEKEGDRQREIERWKEKGAASRNSHSPGHKSKCQPKAWESQEPPKKKHPKTRKEQVTPCLKKEFLWRTINLSTYTLYNAIGEIFG